MILVGRRLVRRGRGYVESQSVSRFLPGACRRARDRRLIYRGPVWGPSPHRTSGHLAQRRSGGSPARRHLAKRPYAV